MYIEEIGTLKKMFMKTYLPSHPSIFRNIYLETYSNFSDILPPKLQTELHFGPMRVGPGSASQWEGRINRYFVAEL